MKKFGFFLLPALLLLPAVLQAQMTFRKGMIMDSVAVGDSIPESFSLYLPTGFEASHKWPVLIVYDMEGRGSQALGMFREAAEEKQYILVASNNTYDSLSISDNILITNRLLKRVLFLFPVNQQRMYTAGLATGAQMAALVPSFIRGVAGVLSLGSDVPNTEILDNKNPFYFLGIVGKGDFNYPDMSKTRELLNRKNFPNNLIVFDGGQEWPDSEYLKMGLDLLTVRAISEGHVAKDDTLLRESYRGMMQRVDKFIYARRFFRAYNMLEQVATIYGRHLEVDSLDNKLKTLRRESLYRSQKRDENSVLLRESLIREDYRYFLEEDILTYNFNNLGWWTYQMEELKKYEKSGKLAEQYMGRRLNGYLNALIEDNIDLLVREKVTDEEALLFLYMLKTISSPLEYPYYLKIISLSSKYEDYGTALFYLEELLKNGYKDKAQLYQLEHTALIRITPEYNAIVAKFLKDARYEIIEE